MTINNYYGGPRGLGGMYDWDIITRVLNAKYPNGIQYSDEIETAKTFTRELNKVQAEMVAKSNEFDERLAQLGDSAALKSFIEAYENPTPTVIPVLVTVSIDGTKKYTTKEAGVLSDVDETNKRAKLDDKAVNISTVYKYDHSDDTGTGTWIYGVTNAYVALSAIGAKDSTVTVDEYAKPNNNGNIAFATKPSSETKWWPYSSNQLFSYTDSVSNYVGKGSVGYFRANEQLTVDAETSAKYGVNVDAYIGKPYAEVTLSKSQEKVILIFGG